MNEIRLPVVDGLALDLHGDEAVAEFREGMPLRSDPRFLQMIQLVGSPS